MKTLLILRHAKTERDNPAGDHARTLTERGIHEATNAGHAVRRLVGTPDRILSSDAHRAVQTAQLAAAVCGGADHLVLDPDLYGADPDTLLAALRRQPDTATTLLLVAHNPGLESLVPLLAGGREAHLPPAGLAHLTLPVDRWANVQPGTATLRDWVLPDD